MADTPVRLPAIWPFNILFVPALFALIIVIATLATDRSYASYMSVRLAPTVTLTNGVELVLKTTVDDSSSDVRHAGYMVHVPRGATVTATGFDGFGSIETVRTRADMRARECSVSVTLETSSDAVAMTVTVQIMGRRRAPSSATVAGTSGQAVSVQLRC
jgi:hypothetical protein